MFTVSGINRRPGSVALNGLNNVNRNNTLPNISVISCFAESLVIASHASFKCNAAKKREARVKTLQSRKFAKLADHVKTEIPAFLRGHLEGVSVKT